MFLKVATAIGMTGLVFALGASVLNGLLPLGGAAAVVGLVAVATLLAGSGVVPRNFGGKR